MLSGTEADIVNSVARLREATRDQIRREVGFSPAYINYLCQYLVRRGYLRFAQGHYALSNKGIKTLWPDETTKIDRKLVKEIAGEVAREISGELEKTVKQIRIPVTQTGYKAEEGAEEPIKIKTDFEFPVQDESLALESNIDKMGPSLEKEKSDIKNKVKLFKEIQKRMGK